MQNGIVAGLVLAIVIPILIALICFIAYCRNRVIYNEKEEYGSYPPYKPPPESFAAKPIIKNSSRQENHLHQGSPSGPLVLSDSFDEKDSPPLKHESTQQRVFENGIHHNQSSYDLDEGVVQPPPPLPPTKSGKKSKLPYKLEQRIRSSSSSASSTTSEESSTSDDAVASFSQGKTTVPKKAYYTHEPVNDKPVIFQNVLWGVEDRNTPSPNNRLHSPSSSQESAV